MSDFWIWLMQMIRGGGGSYELVGRCPMLRPKTEEDKLESSVSEKVKKVARKLRMNTDVLRRDVGRRFRRSVQFRHEPGFKGDAAARSELRVDEV